jgi:hypothetical protein
MKRFARLSIGMTGLAAMAFAVTLLPRQAAKGSVADAVRVVNTPLPVTGTVNATLSGTPTVNIGKLPPVDIDFPSSLKVTNPTVSSQAVPLVTRDAGSLQPFQKMCQANFSGTVPHITCALTTVPTGKRLVIQMASIQVNLNGGMRVPSAGLDSSTLTFLPVQFTATTFDGFDVSVGAQQITMYVEPQTAVGCFASASGFPTTPSAMACAISGYLVDVP